MALSTTYGPGEVTTSTPSGGGGGSLLDEFVAKRMREWEIDRAKARAGRAGGNNARGAAMGARRAPAPAPSRPLASEQQQAPRQIEMEPTYVKMITGGPGIQGGYIQVPAGTPGAVASGMVPVGQGMRRPNSAQIVDPGENVGAGGSFEDFQRSTARRRAIDRTGGF
jgi:hypothetical protein